MQLGPGTMVTSNVRLVRPLGEGGMGSVWQADHLGLDTQVAVKFISAELAKDEQIRARFSREAKATAQIKSPHVVQTFDHGFMPDGTPYIVMEMLHGASLADWLALEGRLRTADAAVVVSQVASALAKAHALGIVHRDIKPANVFMIGSENETFVKVLDFGIAKRGERRAGGITETGVMVGTPEYMSPEQVMSSRDVDHRADLWALAVMAYEMLVGTRPFDGETVGALCVAVAKARFRPPSELVPELAPAFDGFFARALAKRRTDRYQTAYELAEAFESIAGVATRSGAFAALGAKDVDDALHARREPARPPGERPNGAARVKGTAIGLDARSEARRASERAPDERARVPAEVGMSFGPGLAGHGRDGAEDDTESAPGLGPHAAAPSGAVLRAERSGTPWVEPAQNDSEPPPTEAAPIPAPAKSGAGRIREAQGRERSAPRARVPAHHADAPRALTPRRQQSSATVEFEAPPEASAAPEPSARDGEPRSATNGQAGASQRMVLEFDPARERARAALAAERRKAVKTAPIRVWWLLAATLAVVASSVAAHYLEPSAMLVVRNLGKGSYAVYIATTAVLLLGSKLMADASHRAASLTLWLATLGLFVLAACSGVSAAALAGVNVGDLERIVRNAAPFAAAAVPFGLSLFGLVQARNEFVSHVRRPAYGALLLVLALAGIGAGAWLVQRAPTFAGASEPHAA